MVSCFQRKRKPTGNQAGDSELAIRKFARVASGVTGLNGDWRKVNMPSCDLGVAEDTKGFTVGSTFEASENGVSRRSVVEQGLYERTPAVQ